MADVEFFNQDTTFKLPRPRKTKQWIRDVVSGEKKQLAHLNYIFCTDEYLLSINRQYLKHETLTDIITFDNSEEGGVIEGDIFISIERVRANASGLKTDFDEELHRVLIHGVLHLSGYSDKSTRDKSRMRKKEDAYLSLREI
ncbi:MAG: rRNA maturation RNase YbeY [Cyclobacteriaceae bacterium]